MGGAAISARECAWASKYLTTTRISQNQIWAIIAVPSDTLAFRKYTFPYMGKQLLGEMAYMRRKTKSDMLYIAIGSHILDDLEVFPEAPQNTRARRTVRTSVRFV